MDMVPSALKKQATDKLIESVTAANGNMLVRSTRSVSILMQFAARLLMLTAVLGWDVWNKVVRAASVVASCEAALTEQLSRRCLCLESTTVTTGSFVRFCRFLMALADLGATDLAYKSIATETYPSYGYMLNNGNANATTIWESWSFSDNTFSHDHPVRAVPSIGGFCSCLFGPSAACDFLIIS